MRVDEASFVHFVYPFLFSAEEFAVRAEAIRKAKWPGVDNDNGIWETQRFPDEDLLSHVGRYLNPPVGTPPTAHLWRLTGKALQSFAGLGSGAQWRLTFPQGEVQFDIQAVQPALFRVGVGFITLCIKLESDRIADWLDFLHFFRFTRGQRRVNVRAQRRVSRDEVRPFFPEPAGGTATHQDGAGMMGEIMRALLLTGRCDSDTGEWWSEIFVPGQMLPFAALFVKEAGTEEIPRLIYQVRSFFHSRQELHPDKTDLQPDHPALLPYAHQQWFIFSLDGGAFVAADAPGTEFFQHTLPRHLREQYFLLFLLALQQRFALMRLSQQVSEHWLQGEETARERAFERLRDALLEFTARGYFAQVMQREHHHRCYRKWQETFQVERLFQEVSHEVREMHDYLLLKRTERLQQLAEEQGHQMELEAQAQAARERAAQERAQHLGNLISRLGLAIGVPALVIGFLGINLDGITSGSGINWWKALGYSLGGLIVGLLVSQIITWWTQK